MPAYFARRLLIGLFTLWVVTILAYALIRSMPGDPVSVDSEGSQKIDQEENARRRAAYGLDDPWHVGYSNWLSRAVRLDLDSALTGTKRPVVEILQERLKPTLLLTTSSLVLAYLLSIPLGLYCSARSGKPDERVISTGLYMIYSLPSFVAAVLLQSFFSIKLIGTAWELPLAGLVSDNHDQLSSWGQTVDIFKHMILPVFCYTYGALAYEARFIRANMAEVVRQDYIRTARAKGVSEFNVYVKHAFRNTLIPLVTLLGLTFPTLLSGSVILEQIFSLPGMGSLLITSIYARDYPVIMAVVLMFSILTLIGQLVADMLYAVVDPRIAYD